MENLHQSERWIGQWHSIGKLVGSWSVQVEVIRSWRLWHLHKCKIRGKLERIGRISHQTAKKLELDGSAETKQELFKVPVSVMFSNTHMANESHSKVLSESKILNAQESDAQSFSMLSTHPTFTKNDEEEDFLTSYLNLEMADAFGEQSVPLDDLFGSFSCSAVFGNVDEGPVLELTAASTASHLDEIQRNQIFRPNSIFYSGLHADSPAVNPSQINSLQFLDMAHFETAKNINMKSHEYASSFTQYSSSFTHFEKEYSSSFTQFEKEYASSFTQFEKDDSSSNENPVPLKKKK